MAKTGFTAFLRNCTHREDLVGFFAREWVEDTHYGKPTGAKGVQPILDYMADQGSTESAMLAASLAWDEWRASPGRKDKERRARIKAGGLNVREKMPPQASP
jgi:hypothetical protein